MEISSSIVIFIMISNFSPFSLIQEQTNFQKAFFPWHVLTERTHVFHLTSDKNRSVYITILCEHIPNHKYISLFQFPIK